MGKQLEWGGVYLFPVLGSRQMKKLISALLIIIILAAILVSSVPILKGGSQIAKYSDYFDTPERYDIVFLGSSHPLMATLPLELWKDYGYSSYNLANYGQLIQADYWLLKLILTKSAPKLVVLDLYSTQYNDEFNSTNSEYMHGLMDCFPISKLKYDAIKDIFPEDMQKEYFFPLFYYHSKWEKINKSNFVLPEENYFFGQGSDESAFYGISTATRVRPYSDMGNIDSTESEKTDTLGKDYLKKIFDLCRKNNIEVMCTLVPFLAYDDEMKWMNSAIEICEENNVPICNGLTETEIDPATDMFDYGHLNSSGARKWTDTLGKFISENFDISRYTEGETYDFWANEYYSKYINFKAEKISGQSPMYNYLMLCADKNLSVCLYIPEESDIFSDTESLALIGNLCRGMSNPVFSDCKESLNQYFCCIDNLSGRIYESDKQSEIDSSTGVGEISLKDGVLFINGETAADWNDYSPHGINKIQLGIAVIDNSSGSVLDTTWFYRSETGNFVNAE